MAVKKIRVGILCGGKSGEHEVSLQSARNIVEAIDRDTYEVIVIGIDKEGQWSLFDPDHFLLHEDDPTKIRLKPSPEPVALIPSTAKKGLISVDAAEPAF